jgi:5-methylcytosine-specific restriction endonuclease McrA
MPHKDPEAKRAYGQAYQLEHKSQKNAANRAYRLRSGTKLNAKRRAKYAANPIPELLTCARYRKEHPEQRLVLALAYAKRNPEKVNARNRRYQLRKRGAAISDFTLKQWQCLKELYAYTCVYCGREMQRLTQDHVVPISKHGNHTFSNIVPACGACNHAKHDGPPLPFAMALRHPVIFFWQDDA